MRRKVKAKATVLVPEVISFTLLLLTSGKWTQFTLEYDHQIVFTSTIAYKIPQRKLFLSVKLDHPL
jgi:hypothetical protein